MPSNGIEDAIAIDSHLEGAEHINGDGLRRMSFVLLNSVGSVTMPWECNQLLIAP
ncbi:hypothetical protein AM571_PC02012 (plasmid) [Rhizobium etli 8C-3]|uniref:Uncharacterized protein n=1 Tax=Rhizobium etli 8C-3 TaxID=538025 RepID=A0A1L5PHY5_RHIET|nr:hypothetical protein AM571_PC02012 [Rhizobium etli 8C-3]